MTYIKSLIKAIKYPLIIGIGVLIAGFIGNHPQYAEMSVGGLLILIYDIVKHKVGVKLP